jgi:hypothetical protein
MLNEETHNLCSSPNIVRMMKSKRMIWSGYVARMGEMRNVEQILVGMSETRNHSEDLGVDGRVILKYIKRRQCGKV